MSYLAQTQKALVHKNFEQNFLYWTAAKTKPIPMQHSEASNRRRTVQISKQGYQHYGNKPSTTSSSSLLSLLSSVSLKWLLFVNFLSNICEVMDASPIRLLKVLQHNRHQHNPDASEWMCVNLDGAAQTYIHASMCLSCYDHVIWLKPVLASINNRHESAKKKQSTHRRHQINNK